jgi:ribosomal protein S27E
MLYKWKLAMIKEYNKNIVKCHNCSTFWTFNDEDVKEVGTSNQFGDNYKEYFIKCPKCKNHLELYNHKGVWR